MSDFPSFEAELGYAVSRGFLNLTLADVSILARCKSVDQASESAREVRKSARVWGHIRAGIALRIQEITRANIARRQPKNVILAEAHEINRSQTLSEPEVNEIVLAEVWESLPDSPRRRYAR